MSEWVLTDDDVYQHVKQINPHTFAACQILPCLNQVAFGVIDLDCYDVDSRDFFEKYLSPYGYRDIESFGTMWGCYENQILAECILEIDFDEFHHRNADNWDDAERIADEWMREFDAQEVQS